jgi:outer membrane protein insertion porin family
MPSAALPERCARHSAISQARHAARDRPARPHARRRLARLACALAVGALLLATTRGEAGAQQAPPAASAAPTTIVEIEFQGTVYASRGELLSNLASRVGDPLDASQVTRDVKTLFSLGYFQQVRAEAEEAPGRGVILRFVVTEKPRIVAVTLLGNTRVDDEDLFNEVTIQVGSFYSKALAEENAEKIRGVYRNKGYLKVRVTPETEAVGANDHRLRFRIEESPRLYLTDIRVRGTRVFSQLEIKRLMLSAEVDCFDWINDSGVFNEDKINQDLQIIVSSYLERGYVRVFVDRPKVTLIHNPEYSRVIVELSVTEGEQYFLAQQDVTGDILGDKQELLDLLGLRSGNVFNALQQNRDTFVLRETYQEQGYAFVQVRPDVKIHDDTRTVDVAYQIERGAKAYLGRIEFQGNRETRDFVLRREFTVHENELYNGRKLRQSQQALLALGYFEPASLQLGLQPREADNVLDVVAKVEETQTGTLQAQLGYSDQSGLSVSTSVSKGNFLGRGQTLRASVQWSQRGITQNFSLDFIEPHLLGSEYSSDSSVSLRTIEDQTELERGRFTEVYASQGFGHAIAGPLRINLALSALNRSFEDPDEPAVMLRTLTTSLIYNTIDHPIFPTAGSNVTLSVAQVGGQVLGGTTEYRRYRLRAQRFARLNESGSLVLMGRLRLGWLDQVGNNLIPPEERFRLGGISSLRGYDFNEVGGPSGLLDRRINSVPAIQLDGQGQPILDVTGQPIIIDVDRRTLGFDEATLEQLRGGGIQERLFNLELIFPLAGNNIRGVVFYDAGQVNAEPVQYRILGEEEPRFFDLLQSIGTGVRMITPLGVFRLEYGLKLKVRPNESPSRVDFTIGTLF